MSKSIYPQIVVSKVHSPVTNTSNSTSTCAVGWGHKFPLAVGSCESHWIVVSSVEIGVKPHNLYEVKVRPS